MSFEGPAHRCRAGGRVHRDTASIIRCISFVVMVKHASLHTGPHHHNHHDHNNHHNFGSRFVNTLLLVAISWLSPAVDLGWLMAMVPPSGEGSAVYAPGCNTSNRRWLRCPPLVPKGTQDSHQHQGGSGARDVRWPTGTEASTPGEAAGSPAGAGAAGWANHGRIRGCPGAAAGRAVVGQRGRGSRRPLHPPVPPHARH